MLGQRITSTSKVVGTPFKCKRFLDIAIGVLKNIYDSYMPFFPIPASFFDPAIFEDGFSSFLIRFVLEHLFNRKLFYGRSMVKNAF
jgi:hypothetical protein